MDYIKILERLQECHSESLTDWETGFVNDLLYNWEGELTEAQEQTIIKINRRIMRG